MIWREALKNATQVLATAGVEDARVNAEYLVAHALGLKSKSEIRSYLESETPAPIKLRFDEFVLRRANREPLQYILGEWEFFGLPIKVTPAVLIPRPETEILVEEALKEAAGMTGKISILDIGTGSGAIALALAYRLSNAEIVGIDSSAAAIALANENKNLLGLANLTFFQKNILNDWPDINSFDIIVSNPPYVSLEEFEILEPELRLYEPREALTDESTGLTFYERIASVAPKMLKARGRLLVEMGFDASEAVAGIFVSTGFEVIRIVKDLAGISRLLVAALQ